MLEPSELVGIAGNALLLFGPLSELIKAKIKKPCIKPSGHMVFLIVVGLLLNMLYQALTVTPIPVWSFVQSFATIAIWLELYILAKHKL
jgi:hypothetical protein